MSGPYNPSFMIKKAYLAGGCFWGLEELFRKHKGILEITAGSSENAEALEIVYDTDQTDFWHLLDTFFRIHDPTTWNRQGNDLGPSYRSAIFYQNEEEKRLAEDFIALVNQSGRWPSKVVTTLEPFTVFYPAEDYHQDYLQKNPGGYTCHVMRGGSYL